jgi:hypothetical protein
MRRTGDTTRTIDYAIQMLFKHSVIIIPMVFKNHIEFKGEYVIIDKGTFKKESFNLVQEYLKRGIINRINNEHPHIFLDVKENTISILER